MANINLLPWRAERRQKRQQEFYGVIGLVVLAAGFIVFSVNGYYSDAIDNQNRRNNFITTETKVLDAKIAEISALRETRQQLIERMELIQALQGNRPIIVRVFDEMVRAVPEDLYFSAVTVKGTDVNIKGVSKSNNRVAALMRNFAQSDWFDDPTLVFITGKDESAWNFEISMRRVQPKAEEE